MKIIESIDAIERVEKPVLTIGNYDGIHLGHKMIIELVKKKAREIGGTSVLMTFYPHPLSLLRPEKLLGLITPLDAKIKIIEKTGIDVLFIMPFTEKFALLEPEDFVESILLKQINLKGLIVGFDFRFGRFGRGDTRMLRDYSQKNGFFFQVVEPVCINDRKVGSNRIRRLILAGEMADVERFLGRPYCMEGTVVEGDGRGKGLGFPTVNLKTDYSLLPPDGVYITEVEIAGISYPSVTNVGMRPTYQEHVRTIETHIIDFSKELYGQRMVLCFHERIRGEKRFFSVKELQESIALDVEKARRYFSVGLGGQP